LAQGVPDYRAAGNCRIAANRGGDSDAHPDTLRALLSIFELHYAEYLACAGQQEHRRERGERRCRVPSFQTEERFP
jgi:hypothetical protein